MELCVSHLARPSLIKVLSLRRISVRDEMSFEGDHKLTSRREGIAECSTLQPICSCGWKGIPIEAWRDYQHALVKEQGDSHLRNEARKVKAAGEVKP